MLTLENGSQSWRGSLSLLLINFNHLAVQPGTATWNQRCIKTVMIYRSTTGLANNTWYLRYFELVGLVVRLSNKIAVAKHTNKPGEVSAVCRWKHTCRLPLLTHWFYPCRVIYERLCLRKEQWKDRRRVVMNRLKIISTSSITAIFLLGTRNLRRLTLWMSPLVETHWRF